MNKLLIIFSMMIFSFSTLAISDESWGRPIKSAELFKVLESNHWNYTQGTNLIVTLYMKDGENTISGILLTWNPLKLGTMVQEQKTAFFPLTNEAKNLYVGRIDKDNQERFSIAIEASSVNPGSPYETWKVSLRKGFGPCGTGDQTIVLQGEASPVYIIM